MRRNISSPNKPSPPLKNRFTTFLTESGFRPLALVGKSIQCFGIAPVIGCFLGVIATYGYALVKPLPGIEAYYEKPKTVLLQGTVLTSEGQPLDRKFEIGVLYDDVIPVENANQDGTFSVHVPHKDKYSIVVFDSRHEIFKLHNNIDVKQVAGQYLLSTPLRLPTNLGIVEGTVKDQDGRPIRGYIEVAGRPTKLDPHSGYFQLKNIPLGKTKIQIKESIDGPPLYEEDIKINLNDRTPLENIIVRVLDERRNNQ